MSVDGTACHFIARIIIFGLVVVAQQIELTKILNPYVLWETDHCVQFSGNNARRNANINPIRTVIWATHLSHWYSAVTLQLACTVTSVVSSPVTLTVMIAQPCDITRKNGDKNNDADDRNQHQPLSFHHFRRHGFVFRKSTPFAQLCLLGPVSKTIQYGKLKPDWANTVWWFHLRVSLTH